MGQRPDVVEAEHRGRAFDGVHMAEQRVHVGAAAALRFDRQEAGVHLVEPVDRLLTEDVGQLVVELIQILILELDDERRGVPICEHAGDEPARVLKDFDAGELAVQDGARTNGDFALR